MLSLTYFVLYQHKRMRLRLKISDAYLTKSKKLQITGCHTIRYKALPGYSKFVLWGNEVLLP